MSFLRESKILLGFAVAAAFLIGTGAAAGTTATVTATVTVQNISVSVSSGTITWGTLGLNVASSTNAAYTQTATNDGNIAESFSIKGQNSTTWTLGGAAGADTYVQGFCTATCGSAPTNYTALTTTYQTLATNIASSGTQTFDIYINTPTSSSSYTQQSVDVTLQAAAY